MSSLKMLLMILLIILAGCAPAQAQAPVLAEAREPAPTASAAAPTPVPPTLMPTAGATEAPTAAPPAPQPTIDPASPRGVVESFYRWYFDQPRGKVMSERTFLESPLLSEIFKSDTTYLLDSFADGAGYDPFICAQDNLPALEIAQMFISGGEANALAEVIVDGQVLHYFVVSLSAGEGSWKIDAIRCPRQPETPVYAFYTWYLGSIYGEQDVANGGEIRHNLLAEETYRDFFLLTDNFISQIDGKIAENRATGGGADPILNAQAVPVRFFIQPGQEGPDITARLDYDTRSARYHILSLVEVPQGWRVDGIQHVEVPRFDLSSGADVDTTRWAEYQDSEYGFTFRYPGTWWTEAPQPGGLEGDLLNSGMFFHAPGLDPNMPLMWLHVLEGSEAQVINYYVTENHQEAELNGLRVWIDRETCNTRFVFPHPERVNTWLVLGDNCPSQPGREGYAGALEDILAPLLRSVAFE